MKNFDEALANCLDKIDDGASVEEALALHPEYSRELQPLLMTAARVELGRDLRPSEAAKARVRDRLKTHMKSHPRHARRGASNLQRLAMSFAVLLLAFFVTGTAFAQRAVPGETLYGWKRASESVWRVVSADPLGTDLAISERRAVEITRVNSDPARSLRALKDYEDALLRVQDQAGEDSEERVYPSLQIQQELLKTAGITVPELEDYLAKHGKPADSPGNGPSK